MPAPTQLIDELALAPHPEGGWYRETWRAADQVATPRGGRAAGTAILYLLADGATSALHRIRSDEVWFHHRGDALRIHILGDGGARSEILGPHRPQVVVPAGVWFGAELVDPHGWGLVGCAVAPGFDFADFELAAMADLAAFGGGAWRALVAG